MKRFGGVAALAAGIALSAGCGVIPTDAEEATSSNSSTVSPDAWASVVSEQNDKLSPLVDKLVEDCITPSSDIVATTCVYRIETVKLKGSILRKEFDELGDPPDEVEELVTETLGTADSLASFEVSADCSSDSMTALTYYESCAGASSNARRLGVSLRSKYAAWEPYGG